MFWPNCHPDADWVITGRQGERPIWRGLWFDGSPRSTTWEPLDVHLEPGASSGKTFLPWFSQGTLILRDEAIYTIGAILADLGELLRLRCSNAELVAFNALNLTEALELDRSRMHRWKTGSVTVRTAVFSPAAAELGVFKWTGEPAGPIFLSEDVVQRLLATGLTHGTDFPPSDAELPWY